MPDPRPEPWTNVEDPLDCPKISLTELTSLLRCTKKHDYAYRQGLVPAVTPGYFVKGKYLHLLMAQALTFVMGGREPEPGTCIGAARERVIAEHGTLAVGSDESEAVDEQFRSYLKNTNFINTEVLEVEAEFYAQPPGLGGGLLHGIIDALVRVNGDLWLVEHKTAGRAWSQGQFAFDYQSRLYTAAVEALTGERPLGTIYNFFYPKRWETKQVFTEPQESASILAEVEQALTLRDVGIVVRQPHWGCQDCSFKSLCHQELLNLDSEYTRSHDFKVDQDKVDRFAEEE